MRRRARVDTNHAAVVQALRAAGWCVQDTSRLGGGFPDLVIAKGGRVELVEVKDGAKSPSARLLSEAEVKVFNELLRAGVTVRVVESVEQAVNL